MNQLITIPKNECEALDTIASNAALTFASAGGFQDTFAVADAIISLREAITPAMMERITKLQDTALGFRTDRGPGNEKNLPPYSPAVVKECLIETTLRGLRPIGNQWNIIAARAYITKEGYSAMLKKLPGFADFKPFIGVPHLVGDKGAIVPCKAAWTYNGKPDSLECEIPVRVNAYMGADAIIGKAQRKLLKRVYDQATGCETPDGEVDDTPLLPDKPQGAPVTFSSATPQPAPTQPIPQAPTDPQPEAKRRGRPPGSKNAPQAELLPQPPAPATSEPAAASEDGPKKPWKELEKQLTDFNITFDNFRSWLETTGRAKNADSLGGFADLPDALCLALASDQGFGKFVSAWRK